MTTASGTRRSPSAVPGPGQEVALVDLLDRVLAGGVVISGEIILGIADVDLVRISLRALVASIRAAQDGTTAEEPYPHPHSSSSSSSEDAR
ncbi:gas vesicle protein [Streptomyces sp. NPDC051976]|uniref:gas vesicle protein n=1 Tax=Streptomyces sp. NPDC051976 TaxID=3154947 RepID=UPI003414BEF1